MLPLVLYGLAIHDIFEHWRSVFRSKPYVPFVVLVLVLFEASIYSVYQFWNVIQELPNLSYWEYFGVCIPPVLFLLAVKMITPEEGKNPEDYLKEEGRLVFILLGLYAISTYFVATGLYKPVIWVAIAVPIIHFIIAWTRKMELIYLAAIFQLAFILDEIFDWGFLLRH